MIGQNTKLLSAMAARGYNMTRLSEDTGIAHSTLSKIINQKTTPRKGTRRKIVGALGNGYTQKELFGDA